MALLGLILLSSEAPWVPPLSQSLISANSFQLHCVLALLLDGFSLLATGCFKIKWLWSFSNNFDGNDNYNAN